MLFLRSGLVDHGPDLGGFFPGQGALACKGGKECRQRSVKGIFYKFPALHGKKFLTGDQGGDGSPGIHKQSLFTLFHWKAV